MGDLLIGKVDGQNLETVTACRRGLSGIHRPTHPQSIVPAEEFTHQGGDATSQDRTGGKNGGRQSVRHHDVGEMSTGSRRVSATGYGSSGSGRHGLLMGGRVGHLGPAGGFPQLPEALDVPAELFDDQLEVPPLGHARPAEDVVNGGVAEDTPSDARRDLPHSWLPGVEVQLVQPVEQRRDGPGRDRFSF
jgi:hypothetical protein